jgi:restriction system protein
MRSPETKKYTGDGGIDGRCKINGVDYLIQAKRYKAHIQEFAQICNKRQKKGLFVHTGKTGKKSKSVIQNSNLTLISGNRLLDLLFK